MSAFCVSILTSKYKRLLQLKLIDQYRQDLEASAAKMAAAT